MNDAYPLRLTATAGTELVRILEQSL